MDDSTADAANELELSELLPRAVRRNPAFQASESSVSVASMALAVVTLIFGNGTLSAAIAGMSVAAKNSATVGSYLTFADAFILTLPLSVLVTGLVWLGSAERLNAVELAAFGVFGAIGITYLAGKLGIDGPTMSDMIASAGSLGGNWFMQAFGIIGEYLAYYTWVPFLGGIITGFAMGGICAHLSHPDRP
ncbi:MAG: hypothetical protein ACRDQB_18225 [Thermocrispum sp.]